MRKIPILFFTILLLASLTLSVFAADEAPEPPLPEQIQEAGETLDPKLAAMLEWGIAIAEDDSHGYSQTYRFGPNYDCTSFISAALMEGGFGLDHQLSTYTLVSELPDYGFAVYRRGETEPQLGDILVSRGEHAEICMGNGGCLAAHMDYDGWSGDSSGHEIECRSGDDSYGCPFCDRQQYDFILRYEPPETPSPILLHPGSGSCTAEPQ